MPINLIDIIKPKNNGTFPIVEDTDFKGGYRTVADTTARNAIPTEHRKAGMQVFTQNNETAWVLGSGLTNSDWTEVASGGGGSSAVIFDGGGTTQNLTSDRSANQSPIDNTKNGIVNFGSKISIGTGVTNDYGTIGGGLNHSVDGYASVVAGGAENRATGINYASVLGGWLNVAGAEYSTVGGGLRNEATDQHAAVFAGHDNVAAGPGAVVCGGSVNQALSYASIVVGGENNTASSTNAIVLGGKDNSSTAVGAVSWGDTCTASGTWSMASGQNATASRAGEIAYGFNINNGGISKHEVALSGVVINDDDSVSLKDDDGLSLSFPDSIVMKMHISIIGASQAGSGSGLFGCWGFWVYAHTLSGLVYVDDVIAISDETRLIGAANSWTANVNGVGAAISIDCAPIGNTDQTIVFQAIASWQEMPGEV